MEDKQQVQTQTQIDSLEFLVKNHRHTGSDLSQKIDIPDEVTIAASGQTALTGDVVLAAGTNISLGQSGQTITITNSYSFSQLYGLFGDGSDSTGTANGSGTIAGISPSGGTYTLTRDVYFTNLTLSSNAIIDANGYQVFVNGTLTIGSGSYIHNNGGNGGAGGNGGVPTGGTAGTAGAAASTTGTVPASLAGVAGAVGGAGGGVPFVGNTGGAGTDVTTSLGVAGTTTRSLTARVGGGFGGSPGAAGGDAPIDGGGDVTSSAVNNPHTLNGCYIHADLISSYTQHKGSASSASGASGGGGRGANAGGGGGGGGSGAPGGFVCVYARTIINNATGGIRANGGTGGAGGNGGNASSSAGGGAGGAGGAGGSGGVVITVYASLTQNGTFTAAGGSAGIGGDGGSGADGGAAGEPGLAGFDGNAGNIWQYQLV